MRTLLLAFGLVPLFCATALGQSATVEPSTRQEWIRLAHVAMGAARFDEARADLAGAAALADANDEALADAWADLGDALFRAGDPRAAIAAYTSAIQRAPSVPSYHVARGWALHAIHDAMRARAEIAIARQIDPGSSDARALEIRLDDAVTTRIALFVTGGIAIGLGVILALVGGLLYGLAPPTPPRDQTAPDWLIASGLTLAVGGIVATILGEALHLGSTELPRRAGGPGLSF